MRPSYAHGASSRPLLGLTIGSAFDETVAGHPDRLALIVRHQGVRWTYAELKQRVDAMAAGLLALGLEPGDRIGVWAPNCAEWAVTQFATAKAGLILVNINPAYRLSEAEYALNTVGCKALVTAVAHKSSAYLAMLRELAPELDAATPGALRARGLRTCGWSSPSATGGTRAVWPSPTSWRRPDPVSASGWRRSARACSSTTRSTSSSRAGRRVSPRARR